MTACVVSLDRIEQGASRNGDVEAIMRGAPCRRANLVAEADVARQQAYLLKQCSFIALGNQIPVLSRSDHFWRGANVAGDDRETGAHCFHNRYRPCLPETEAGQYERVRPGQQIKNLRLR